MAKESPWMFVKNQKSSMSIAILLGSLVLLIVTDSDAAKVKKYHGKRQVSPPFLYRPPQSTSLYGRPMTRPYLQPPRYPQYNTAFKNVAPIQPAKQLQTALAGSQYSKIFKAQPQRQYVSFYYPHRTHYRDWSRKLLEASAFARKLQDNRKQNLLHQKQKSDPSNAGIKLFVAGVNPNGKVFQQLANQGKIHKPNGQLLANKPLKQNVAAKIPVAQLSGATGPLQQSASPVSISNMNNGPPSGTAFVANHPELQANQPFKNPIQHPETNMKANQLSPVPTLGGVAVGNAINANLQSQPGVDPSLGKGSTTNLNSNGAILSDKFEGAALGPKAHSLLQPNPGQQPGQSGNLMQGQGGQIGVKKASDNPQPKVNYTPLNSGNNINNGSPSNDNTPRQGQPKNVPSSSNQQPLVNKGPDNFIVLGNSLSMSLENTDSLLQTSASDKPVPGRSQASSPKQVMKNIQPPKDLALDSANVDKSTAQELNAGLAFTSASRPPSQTVVTQPSSPNSAPNDKNSASRNNLPGSVSRDQTQLDRELALKNLLFPPPAATGNQAYGTNPRVTSNSVQAQQPQQISQGQVDNTIPTFPAFRCDPAAGQTGFGSYRRNHIPHFPSANGKKSLVPQHNKVPYKSSFPLMLHKVSPYFKMKRNLKLMASEQAKARRRLLELQPIK